MAHAANPSFHVLLLFISLASSLSMGAVQYNVRSYGAKPDGKTDSTKAFLAAWTQACASTKSATIYVPKGRFLLSRVAFQGPCKNNATFLRIDGSLVAPSDYRVIGSSQNWIIFEHVNGVKVSGGVIDGRGTGLWSCKNSGKTCPDGATVSIFFCDIIFFIQAMDMIVLICTCSHLNSQIQTTL